MKIKGKKINFLGDSITQGNGVTNMENRFDNYLSREYGIINNNYGIGGTRIARQTAVSDPERFDLDFVSRAQVMDATADIIIVFGGTNDFGHGDAPLGKLGDKTIRTFYGAVDRLCNVLNECYPNAVKVVFTPIKREEGEIPKQRVLIDGSISQNLPTYVNAMLEVGKNYPNIYFINAYEDFKVNPDIEEDRVKYTADGLHLNDEGSTYFGKFIYQTLKKI